MKDKWTQQFQGKMDGYEKAAPEMPWGELDNALAANRRGTMRIVWGRRMAAAAAVLLLVVGGGLLMFNNTEMPEGGDMSIASVKAYGSHDNVNTPAPADGMLAEVNQVVEHKMNKAIERYEKEMSEVQLAEASVGDAKSATANVDQAAAKEEKQAEPKNAEPKNTEYRTYRQQPVRGKKPVKRNRPADSRLMAAVYMENAMVNRGNNGGQSTILNSALDMNKPYGAVSDEFKAGSIGFLVDSNPKDVRYDHNRPIKVGLSVKYNLSNRWSISSGLTYSYLRSTFDYSEGKAFGSGVQKLHYVGLPLAASYNLVSAKRLKVYLTAGGEMQKLVSGKAVIDGVNMTDEDKRQDVREGGMQWSLNVAAGAEYNLTDNLGVYAEPGVSHYIDNRSSVENFYKYKPTNFSLNFGLRLTIR